jgi:hypothetical protein
MADTDPVVRMRVGDALEKPAALILLPSKNSNPPY